MQTNSPTASRTEAEGAESRQRFSVRSVRKWLEFVTNKLGTELYWRLLLFSFFTDFDFSVLERMQNPHDLYNKIVDKHKGSHDTALLVFVHRLSLLKAVGQGCISKMQRYDLSLPESGNQLLEGRTQEAELVECIVKTVMELDSLPQQDWLLQHLRRNLLQTHSNLSFFRAFSKLLQDGVIGPNKTRPLVDQLLELNVPRQALHPLEKYHEKYDLGPIPFVLTRNPPRGLRGPVVADSNLPAGGAGPDLPSASQTMPLLSQSTGRPHVGCRLLGTKRQCAETHPRFCCFVTLLLVAAVIVAGFSVGVSFPVFKNIHSSRSEHRYAIANSTVALLELSSHWSYSVTITVAPEASEIPYIATLYKVAEVVTYDMPPKPYHEIHDIQGPDREVAHLLHSYLFRGASVIYEICLQNNGETPAHVTFFVFGNKDDYDGFIDGDTDGYHYSVFHRDLDVGITVPVCTNVPFIAHDSSFFFFTAAVLNAANVNVNYTRTEYLKYVNLSDYSSPFCNVSSEHECIVEFENSILPFNKEWTILAHIAPQPSSSDPYETHYKGNIIYKFDLSVVSPVLIGVIAIALLVMCCFCIYRCYRKRKPDKYTFCIP